jgi:hypothetical protein
MRTSVRARRPLVVAAALALVVILPACGGGGGGGGNNAPSTLPPAPTTTRTQIQQGGFTIASVGDANRAGFSIDIAVAPLTIPASGVLEVVADWTFASNDVDIIVYNQPCTAAQAVRDQCGIAGRTVSTTTKPERLTINGAPAGNFAIGFANYGNTSESGNYQVFLTR